MNKEEGLLVVLSAFEGDNVGTLTPELTTVFPSIKKTNSRLYLLTHSGKKVVEFPIDLSDPINQDDSKINKDTLYMWCRYYMINDKMPVIQDQIRNLTGR